MFNKKKPITEVIEFNKQKLTEEAGRIGDMLYVFKEDEGMRYVMRVIDLWRNSAVLDVSMARSDSERIALQARLSAFDDLKFALERDVNRTPKENRDESKRPTGTLKLFRRVSNQAESSI